MLQFDDLKNHLRRHDCDAFRVAADSLDFFFRVSDGADVSECRMMRHGRGNHLGDYKNVPTFFL